VHGTQRFLGCSAPARMASFYCGGTNFFQLLPCTYSSCYYYYIHALRKTNAIAFADSECVATIAMPLLSL
jgi:hypothetical protein